MKAINIVIMDYIQWYANTLTIYIEKEITKTFITQKITKEFYQIKNQRISWFWRKKLVIVVKFLPPPLPPKNLFLFHPCQESFLPSALVQKQVLIQNSIFKGKCCSNYLILHSLPSLSTLENWCWKIIQVESFKWEYY